MMGCMTWWRQKKAAMKLVLQEAFVRRDDASRSHAQQPHATDINTYYTTSTKEGKDNASNRNGSNASKSAKENVKNENNGNGSSNSQSGDEIAPSTAASKMDVAATATATIYNDNDSSPSLFTNDIDMSLEKKQELAQALEHGLSVKDHWYRARKYPDTFVGREAVDYMLEGGMATCRKQAVQIGQMLARDFNLLEHVHRDHDFKDEYLFYRFTPPQERFLSLSDELATLFLLGNAALESSSSSDEFTKKTLTEVAIKFQDGIPLGDHTYRLKVYKDTFVGSQAVDYMIQTGMAATRQRAVDLGRALQSQLGLFHHVCNQHELKDQYLFYRLTPRHEEQVSNRTTTKMTLEEIAVEFEKGVPVQDHRYHCQCYPDSFVASQAVDYLVSSNICSSKREAVRIGQALQERFHLFAPVISGTMFRDDYLFFRFAPESQRRLISSRTTSLDDSTSTAHSTHDLEQVAEAFQKGVSVQNNRYRLKTYKDTFVGSQAVDFMVHSSMAPSRREAVYLGRRLAKECNLFSHVTQSHEFSDDYLFYRFSSSYGSHCRRLSLSSSREESILPPEKMAQALRDGGVQLKDRKYHLKTYKQVFLGSEAVDFLVNSEFVENRTEAVELGRSLAREFDLFQHVTREHELEDAPLFYRFVNLGEIRPMDTFALSLGTSRLREIAREFEKGVPVGVHRHRLRMYNDAFLGNEAVDFLVESGHATTRQQALYIGRALADKFNLFEHVHRDHLLADASLFFRFVKESSRTLWSDQGDDDEDSLVPIPRFGVVSADEEWRQKVQAFEVKIMSKKTSNSSVVDVERIDASVRLKRWAREFRRLDPRYQILNYFHDVAQDGTDKIEETGINPDLLRPLLRYFSRASVFTVFRPTSFAAIRRMILGEAVGKGLDIKGKSAKRGKLSGFVPFLQISKNRHKQKVRTLPKDGTVRLFFPENARRGRDVAAEKLEAVAEEMIDTVQMAKRVFTDDGANEDMRQDAMQSMLLDMANPSIAYVEDYAPKYYGLEIPVRLFWEAYVVRQDISRKPGSEYDTGRPSQPAFQDMNCASLRRPPKAGEPRAVLFHYAASENPMCPFNLLMAYEEPEIDRVLPVVSDFDCFLVGTRGVSFSAPLATDQLNILKWCVSNIESILDSPGEQCATWTSRWLKVLKTASKSGFHPRIPKYGFGDPKTYSLMEQAIARLKKQGAVRHGSECFNYYFPQDLDEEFLVISDSLLDKNLPWIYVGVEGLQEILLSKIDEGYTFPLNPKWILCDPGWKQIYDKLLASEKAHIQDSLNVWYPQDSGLRQQIEDIYQRHPNGFQRFSLNDAPLIDERASGTTSMDLALQNLKEGSLRSQFEQAEATIKEET